MTETKKKAKAKPPDAPRRAAVGGRPSHLTEELIEEAAGYLRDGTPITTIAALLGVGVSTFHEWIKRGKIEERRLEQTKTRRPKATEIMFLMLYRTIVEQRAVFEHAALARIGKAAEAGAWAADAWLLKTLFPERYTERRYNTLRVDPAKGIGAGGGGAGRRQLTDPTTAPTTFLDMAKQVFAVAPAAATPETAAVFGAAPTPPAKVLVPEIVSGGAAEENHGDEEEAAAEEDPIFSDPFTDDGT